MERKKELSHIFQFLLLSVLFFVLLTKLSTAFPIVSSLVVQDLKNNGYADVVVFIEATLPQETQQLLEQQQFTVQTDEAALQKILKEQKKAVQKQQQNILKKMDVVSIDGTTDTLEDVSLDTLENNNVDIVLEEKYEYLNAFTGVLTWDGYEILSHDSHVLAIYPNEQLQLTLDTAIPFVHGTFPETVSINGNMINGSGVGICVIDTGIDTMHPDLQGNIVDQYCYCSQGSGCCPNGLKEDSSAEDDNGHGTAVIGTIAAHNSAFSGVAPGAQIMVVKAFSSSGSATTGDVLSAINKCLERATENNIKIFSMSFGGTTYAGNCDNDPLAVVTNALAAEGFFVAAASGNNAESTKISTPACASNVTSVGAVYDNSSSFADTVASFSNVNGILDILAPGVGICTTKASRDGSSSTCFTSSSGGKYRSYSGTSFSAPIVAGAAAVVAQYKQQESGTVLSPQTLQSYLTAYGQQVLDTRNGVVFPRLDLESTLLHIDATSPTVQFESQTPANQSIVDKNENSTVNVTVQDAVNKIVLCKFETNGTNTTMSLVGVGRTVSCLHSFILEGTMVYKVYAMDANGNTAASEERTLSVKEDVAQTPAATNVTITPSPLSRLTNATCSYRYSDPNNDTESGTTILWYINGSIEENLTNQTTILSTLLHVGEAWQCGIIVSDGNNTANISLSEAVSVINYAPFLSVQNSTVNETEQVIISVAATDTENDSLTVTLNDSRFSFENGVYVLNTTTNSSGIFSVIITASDGYESVSEDAQITILDAVDHDSDGIPDVADDDDDGDGIADAADLVAGNATAVNLSEISIQFNGNTVLPNSSSEVVEVSFVAGVQTIVTFSHNFSESNLSLYDVIIMNQSETNGNIVIQNLNVTTKTVFIEQVNTSATGVCVLDTEVASLAEISSSCIETEEYFVPCNGTTVSGYGCTISNDVYEISGLHHSAVEQKCVDGDGDGYGNGCALGADCDDTRSQVNPATTEIADNGRDDNCDGTSTTSPAPIVPEEIPATTAAVAGGGGGGGGGPSFEDEESAPAETSDSQETATKDAEQQKADATETTQEPEQEAQEKTTTQEESVSQKIFALTGAAVSDLGKGELSLKSVSFLGMIVLIFTGLFIGGYAMRKKRNPVKKENKELREYFSDLVEGFKDYFRK